ncbi:hypothetical protein L2E82_29702 [Cichorium intybus]|uniref:Uncharacterized protein n=1 Tax=Cichorium intybus TaxID=13427 RepID=A0ACB9CY97_CICIN|nr:hypothetical protein L2E82_29702 [Cichorium intybus]
MDTVVERIEEALDIQENVAATTEFVMKDINFSRGKPPAAAFIIYKSLLHWKCLEGERTSVFDHLLQIIHSKFKVITSITMTNAPFQIHID